MSIIKIGDRLVAIGYSQHQYIHILGDIPNQVGVFEIGENILLSLSLIIRCYRPCYMVRDTCDTTLYY